MGMLESMLAGAVGAEMATVVNGVIARHGGLQGLVSQFQQQGLGATVNSWVGTGPNQPITPAEVHQVVGTDTVNDLAAKAGMSVPDFLSRLSSVLPQAVDKLTPTGILPG
jgi:uncharacterized protein YidB (DUF937 family)